MTIEQLAALEAAMDLDPLKSSHIISPGYEKYANLTEIIDGGRARAIAMIPIPWSDGLAAMRNHWPALLEALKYATAVCGKEMEIDGITFRQQELIDPLRRALAALKEIR